MALLLDTSTLPAERRADAVRAAMNDARVPALLTHEPANHQVHARLDLWGLGGGAALMHRTSSGIRLRRTPHQVRRTAEDRVALCVIGPGRWSFAQRDRQVTTESKEWHLLLVDHAEPYEFTRSGDGSTYALNVDHTTLGLPLGAVHEAAGRLATNPLHDLVRRHVLGVARRIDEVPPGPATTMLGTASVELIRALLSDAEPDLLGRTKDYIRRHHADPALTPRRIATAHAISLRRLYQVWTADDHTLAEHLLTVRLEAARARLARPTTIAAAARGAGFVDMSHFARSFRRAYGLSPREWRAQTADDPAR